MTAMVSSPQDTDYLAVVCAALAAEADPDLDGIDPEWQLPLIPGLESVKALRAVVRIEDECGIAIPDDFMFETNTVRQLADLVERLVEKSR
jgi:acyl carrier protein